MFELFSMLIAPERFISIFRRTRTALRRLFHTDTYSKKTHKFPLSLRRPFRLPFLYVNVQKLPLSCPPAPKKRCLWCASCRNFPLYFLHFLIFSVSGLFLCSKSPFFPLLFLPLAAQSAALASRRSRCAPRSVSAFGAPSACWRRFRPSPALLCRPACLLWPLQFLPAIRPRSARRPPVLPFPSSSSSSKRRLRPRRSCLASDLLRVRRSVCLLPLSAGGASVLFRPVALILFFFSFFLYFTCIFPLFMI